MIADLLFSVQAAVSDAPSIIRYASVEPGEIIVTAIVFGSGVALFTPLLRAWARRIEGRHGIAPPQLAAVEERLDRIERGVEAISIEVERISEGQRFTTKLLADRGASPHESRPNLERPS